MATVERISSEPLPPPPDKIVLTLTETEANVIYALVGGTDTYDSPSAASDAVNAIYRALHDSLGSDPYGPYRLKSTAILVES